MKEIKLTKQMIQILEKYKFSQDNNSNDYIMSKEKELEVLKNFGFTTDDNVEINDFFQFSRYFGFNKELYLLLRPLKNDAEVTWEDICNIKYGDIDFQNNTVSFTQTIK